MRYTHLVPFEEDTGALVSVVMGSRSDWAPCMQYACNILEEFEIPFETGIISAHRTPDRMIQYAETAASGTLQVIIAGAGGAAHLPGMISSETILPVIGVPVKSSALSGVDSLLSIVQMPAGIPTMTMSIGKAGAINAALAAVRILALNDKKVRTRLEAYIAAQADSVPITPYDDHEIR